MDVSFGEALLYSGALLAVAAALSGLMRGTVLSISVLSVAAGVTLALTGAIDVDADDSDRRQPVPAGADRHPVLRRALRRARAPLSPLEPAGAGAGDRDAAHPRPPGGGGQAAVLRAELGRGLPARMRCSRATDPVVTSAVVTSQRVPATVRHALNLESGLNDGLALPFVLFFIILASPGGDAGQEGMELLGEAAVGAGIGVALGARRRSAHPTSSRRRDRPPLRGHLRARGRDLRLRSRRRHLRQRPDRGLRLRDRARGRRARHRRRLRRLQRERQLDPPGAHLLRLRRADRRHRLWRQHPATGGLHRLRPARRTPAWRSPSPSSGCGCPGRTEPSSPGSGPRESPRCCSRFWCSTRRSARAS